MVQAETQLTYNKYTYITFHQGHFGIISPAQKEYLHVCSLYMYCIPNNVLFCFSWLNNIQTISACDEILCSTHDIKMPWQYDCYTEQQTKITTIACVLLPISTSRFDSLNVKLIASAATIQNSQRLRLHKQEVWLWLAHFTWHAKAFQSS